MKRTLLVATLLLALVSGCSCPPTGGGQGGRNRDSSDVTFAFFGGLKCLFGEPAQKEPRDRGLRPQDDDDRREA